MFGWIKRLFGPYEPKRKPDEAAAAWLKRMREWPVTVEPRAGCTGQVPPRRPPAVTHLRPSYPPPTPSPTARRDSDNLTGWPFMSPAAGSSPDPAPEPSAFASGRGGDYGGGGSSGSWDSGPSSSGSSSSSSDSGSSGGSD